MLGMSNFHYSHIRQYRSYSRTRFLIPRTDIYFQHRRAPSIMSTPRPKRTRAQVNYVEPTELDDDIAVEDDPVEPEAAAADDPVDDQSTDSDTSADDSDAEEFTTDKVSTE